MGGGGGKKTERYAGKVVLAPMVKIGTLPMRLLALRFGADLVYTEEIIDWKILRSTRRVNDMLGTVEYLDDTDGTLIFSTNAEEKDKVILQVGTSDPDRAVQVLKKVEKDVSGLDVNMGCPKEFSIKGGCGAALLKQPEKVKAILSALVAEATIPVTCKIRVLSTLEATIELALLIQDCGVSAIGIHGRTKDERQGHKNRNAFIKAVAERLEIPVIANGGSREVRSFEDIEKFRADCGSSSVMLARAAEWNCSIFRKEGKVDLETLLKSYIELAVMTNNPFPLTKYTMQNMLRELQETPRGKKFLATQTIGEICSIWHLDEFYSKKQAEWETFKKANKRPHEIEAVENEADLGSKKLKSDDTSADPSLIIVPKCAFFRGHYGNNEDLPKSILCKWASTQGFSTLPVYSTEHNDKRFRSIVSIGGKRFRTDSWERNKKHAEQAAALACVRFMNIIPS